MTRKKNALRSIALTLAVAMPLTGAAGPALAAGEAAAPTAQDWSFNGIFGTFDRAAAQRGFQVYREVCQSCHGLDFIDFRMLTDIGFSEDEVAAIADDYTVMDGPNEDGDMFERVATPADGVPNPYPNEQAARAANNNAYPPDLSLIVEARADGANYLYSLLLGYVDPPEDVSVPPGQYYNAYYPGNLIAMPRLLQDGLIDYSDGTEASAEQMAWDVTTFLAWASEPNMEERKQTGVSVVLFLLVFTGMMYAVKRKVWSDVH